MNGEGGGSRERQGRAGRKPTLRGDGCRARMGLGCNAGRQSLGLQFWVSLGAKGVGFEGDGLGGLMMRALGRWQVA